MSLLNQVIAIANGRKTKVTKDITETYKKIQKNALFDGINRSYQPLDDDGETFPPEKKNIQYSAKEAITEFSESLSSLFDIVATQDWANTHAVADVIIGDKKILEKVPVTYLLFLEKQLNDINTFIKTLPVLDSADSWHWSDVANCYVSDVTRTNKTKKVLRNHVKSPATQQHPAQVETYSEDIKVGEWSTTKFSGAIPAQEKNQMLEKVANLQDAVKIAREKANMTEVNSVTVSNSVFDYIFK